MQYRATAYESILNIQSYSHHLRSVPNFPPDWILCFPKKALVAQRKSERVVCLVNKTV